MRIEFYTFRMRQEVIVQTANVCDWKLDLDCRLCIRSKKFPVFPGMLEFAELDIKRFLDVLNRSVYVQDQPINVTRCGCQVVSLSKLYHLLVLLLRRAKLIRELPRRKIISVGGVGRVIEPIKKFVQTCGIRQRQSNRQI